VHVDHAKAGRGEISATGVARRIPGDDRRPDPGGRVALAGGARRGIGLSLLMNLAGAAMVLAAWPARGRYIIL